MRSQRANGELLQLLQPGGADMIRLVLPSCEQLELAAIADRHFCDEKLKRYRIGSAGYLDENLRSSLTTEKSLHCEIRVI